MDTHIDWRFTPFNYQGKLMGEIVSADGTSEAIFSEGDVAEIVRFATTGNQFDGAVAVILRLSDGRLVAYDTSYASYSGNDFTDGNGVVFVAQSIAPLIRRLSDYGQRLINYESENRK